MKKKRLYFDYAASTPLDLRVQEVMTSYYADHFGNPGSVHGFGQAAMNAVDHAREVIADVVGGAQKEVVFTSSATEANNLALRGVVRGFWRRFFDDPGEKAAKNITPHIITTAIEHESVLRTIYDIKERGAADVTILPVGKNGILDLEVFSKALRPETVLVSVMYVNNEIGTIQPISEIAKIIRNFRNRQPTTNPENSLTSSGYGAGNQQLTTGTGYPLLHTDAVQAFQYLPCDVESLGVDLMTLSSHKLYGPKGAGVLYVRGGNSAMIDPLITGGGQEYGLRSGTENTSAIVGFGKAVEIASTVRDKEAIRVAELRDYVLNILQKKIPSLHVNGSMENRLPNNLNIVTPLSAEEALIKLDLSGIAISAGSACSARSTMPSYVLRALGANESRARNSIRITLGRPTTKNEIDALLDALVQLYITP